MLPIALAAAVPLRIAELQKRGGPTDTDLEHAKAFAQVLCERGDVLMFGGKTKGEAAQLFNRLAYTLAVMAHLPGGVHFAGEHWIAAWP